MSTRIQLRRGTPAEWAMVANSVILAAGEMGLEMNPATLEVRYKVGDGVRVWSALPYGLRGEKGDKGDKGDSGTAHVLPTQGKPSNAVGVDGDLAIDAAAKKLYTKAGGAWNDGEELGGAVTAGAVLAVMQLADAGTKSAMLTALSEPVPNRNELLLWMEWGAVASMISVGGDLYGLHMGNPCGGLSFFPIPLPDQAVYFSMPSHLYVAQKFPIPGRECRGYFLPEDGCYPGPYGDAQLASLILTTLNGYGTYPKSFPGYGTLGHVDLTALAEPNEDGRAAKRELESRGWQVLVRDPSTPNGAGFTLFANGSAYRPYRALVVSGGVTYTVVGAENERTLWFKEGDWFPEDWSSNALTNDGWTSANAYWPDVTAIGATGAATLYGWDWPWLNGDSLSFPAPTFEQFGFSVFPTDGNPVTVNVPVFGQIQVAAGMQADGVWAPAANGSFPVYSQDGGVSWYPFYDPPVPFTDIPLFDSLFVYGMGACSGGDQGSGLMFTKMFTDGVMTHYVRGYGQ